MVLEKYFSGLRKFGERIDTALIRLLFNKYYDPRNAVVSSRLPQRRSVENHLATSFLGWDYLLDGFGEVSKRDASRSRYVFGGEVK
jgi:hypothetical protein